MLFTAITVLAWLSLILLGSSLIDSEYWHDLRSFGWIAMSTAVVLLGPHFWIHQQSVIQSVLSVAGGFGGLYLSYLIANGEMKLRQTTVLCTLSSFLLLLVYTIQPVQWALIELVADNTMSILHLLGYTVALENSTGGIKIIFVDQTPQLFTKLVVACTGIGSIALFVGLAGAIDKISMQMRVLIALMATTIIYLLNIVRNVFIAAAYGQQWFHIAPEYVGMIFGRSDEWVSFYIADKVLAQTGAVIVLVLLAIMILKYLPKDTKLEREWISIIDAFIDLTK